MQSRTPIPHSGVARRLEFGVTPVRAVPTGVGESAELAAVLWDSTDMYRHELSEWGGEKGAAYHRWEKEVRRYLAETAIRLGKGELSCDRAFSLIRTTVRSHSRAELYIGEVIKQLQEDQLAARAGKQPDMKDLPVVEEDGFQQVELTKADLNALVAAAVAKQLKALAASTLGREEESGEENKGGTSTGLWADTEAVYWGPDGLPLGPHAMVVEKLFLTLQREFQAGGVEEETAFQHIKQSQAEDLEAFISRFTQAHKSVANRIPEGEACAIFVRALRDREVADAVEKNVRSAPVSERRIRGVAAVARTATEWQRLKVVSEQKAGLTRRLGAAGEQRGTGRPVGFDSTKTGRHPDARCTLHPDKFHSNRDCKHPDHPLRRAQQVSV